MESYIVNKNAQIQTGEHKIHKQNCKQGPKDKNVIELGEFENSKRVVCEAYKYYSCINGCKYCCKEIMIK